MSKGTLPGLARKRRDIRAEAAIPCATGTPATSAVATHLTGDRDREPSFADLIAGNDREPSHDDLLADDEDDQALPPTARELPIAYPGVGSDVMTWLREQDVDDRLAAVAAKAAEWLRAQDLNVEQPPATPAIEKPSTTPTVSGHDEHAFDPDRLVPAGLMVPLPIAAAAPRVETPVADQCAAIGLLYASRHTTGLAVSL